MGASRRERHRDREPGHKGIEDTAPPGTDRVFRLTDDQRQDIARSLRYIDDARLALQAHQNADNREIIRELRTSADRIFDVLNELEEIESAAG